MPRKILYLYRIVRRFFCNVNIVRVGFFQTCSGDLYKLCLFVKFLYGFAAAVTHSRTYSAYKLEYGIRYHSFVWNTSFYAFGNKLSAALLEISVL